jgi:NAD(P)-dependent dehydrogenase (short-subunit alcohol dehydrogenase family)
MGRIDMTEHRRENVPQTRDLDGRTAVITGGGRGIGLACAHALAGAGARIVLLERDESAADEGAAELVAAGADVMHHIVDVTDPDAVDAAARRIASSGYEVDVLVCSAGIAISGVAAENATNDQWRRVVDVNINGVFWCCRAFGRSMLARGRGSIVAIGSMSGIIVNHPQEQASYNASKAAVHHLVKSLAAEWASRGVRVNAVAPTYIDTPMTRYGMQNDDLREAWLSATPMRRIGRPEEVASIVRFLASDDSSLMTGSIVVADAGYTCW